MVVKVILRSIAFVSVILADWSVCSIPDISQVTEMKIIPAYNIPEVTFAKEELMILNPISEDRFKGFLVTVNEIVYKVNQEDGMDKFTDGDFMDATDNFSVKSGSVSYPGKTGVSLNKSFLPALILLPKDERIEANLNDTQVKFVLNTGRQVTLDAFPAHLRGDNKDVDEKCLIVDGKRLDSLISKVAESVTDIVGMTGGEAAVRYVFWTGRIPNQYSSEDTDSDKVKADKKQRRALWNGNPICMRFQPGSHSYPRRLFHWLKSLVPRGTVGKNH